MVHAVEKNTGSEFSLQEGYELIVKSGGKAQPLAVCVPILVGNDLEKKQIATAISNTPGYEALVYAMCLQAIEWVIKATLATSSLK